METSKTLVNILIVSAIILIGISVTSVLIKKSNEQIAVVTVATTTEKVIQEVPTVATTTTDSTTTEVVTTISTSTASSTSNTEGFVGKKWTWVKTTMNASSTTPKKATAFTITFTATGTLSGTTDCNNFFGTYKSSSSTLTFGPLGATRMFCDGSQESDFMSVLQKVTKYEVNKESNLVLSVGTGTMVFK